MLCTAPNLEKPLVIINTTERIIKGIVTASTTAREGRRDIAIISAPISMPGALKAMRRVIFTMFCICVTSFVSLVTSDPVENLSMFANEKRCTFW